MNLFLATFIYCSAITFVFSILVLFLDAYPFILTTNPDEHVKRYNDGLEKFTKKIINSKDIRYEFDNDKTDKNRKSITVEYKKLLWFYYRSKHFHYSKNLIIYHSGLYRKREETV